MNELTRKRFWYGGLSGLLGVNIADKQIVDEWISGQLAERAKDPSKRTFLPTDDAFAVKDRSRTRLIRENEANGRLPLTLKELVDRLKVKPRKHDKVYLGQPSPDLKTGSSAPSLCPGEFD